MNPQDIHPLADSLIIQGPAGAVRVWQTGQNIEVEYQGQELVNGSARAYAQQRLAAAIQYCQEFPLSWTIDVDGQQHITDHKRFYQQGFQSELQGIETLRRWAGAPTQTRANPQDRPDT
jgi:predicted GNAT family N-acyltransferase